jgi:O-acetyl-ADP-ribose deacetylase (regulator of RNase III)
MTYISTSVYGPPVNRTADITLRKTRARLAHDATIDKVTFVCFTPGLNERRVLIVYEISPRRLLTGG